MEWVLTLGTVEFAAIAFFTGLYYASRHWIDPALAVILFGSCFMVTRLLFVWPRDHRPAAFCRSKERHHIGEPGFVPVSRTMVHIGG
jgi:hypothetical protein